MIDPEEIWDRLVEFFGTNLAHPDHEPKRFVYQMKIYKYIMSQKPPINSQKDNHDRVT